MIYCIGDLGPGGEKGHPEARARLPPSASASDQPDCGEEGGAWGGCGGGGRGAFALGDGLEKTTQVLMGLSLSFLCRGGEEDGVLRGTGCRASMQYFKVSFLGSWVEE